ncbi:MAG: hypothetical protein EOM24_31385 [Chloroflexia bacterium]|nr:hypothetical protein [Chloroflexia bacterium]
MTDNNKRVPNLDHTPVTSNIALLGGFGSWIHHVVAAAASFGAELTHDQQLFHALMSDTPEDVVDRLEQSGYFEE